ncbi:O-antigen ligase family protein [Neobacillus sp. 114]|uniref:O-antigen ligase family protein n=1 Tax=Neobacillus sp. 114 TaxID=3048535 RepID=UPI0024C30122|nr:O-antigen ligase family protein [Neobacillus sp. 114]
MFWFLLSFPLMIYPWGYDPSYTMPKVAYLNIFVLGSWLFIILRKKYWTMNLKKPYQSVELIVVIFLCLAIISTIFSVNLKTSLYGTKYRYEGILTYFSYLSIFLFSYKLLDVNKIQKIFIGMAIVSIPASIYGVLQHYFLDFFPRNSSKLLDPRSYSFFDNANFFGSYLVLIILGTISLYLTAKNRKQSTYFLFIIGLAFIALLFTQTRSGYVGVFCGLTLISFLVVFKRRQLWENWTKLIITLMVIFIAINVLEQGNYINRLVSVVSDSKKLVEKDNTDQVGSFRFFIWRKSLPLIHDYFWTGSGPDTLEYVFPNDKEKKKIFGDMVVDKAHNEYLHMAITLGVPALLVYLLLLSIILWRTLQAAKAAKGNDKIILLCLFSAITGYLIQAFFNISVVPVAPLFWATIGMTLAKAEACLNKKRSNHSLRSSEEKYQTA